MSGETSSTTATATATSPPPSPLAKRPKMSHCTANTDAATMAPAAAPSPPLLIKKLSPQARLPTRGSAFAAGYDLYAARDTNIPARGKALVETDIAIAVPDGTCKPPPSPTPRAH
jgi:dUTP pyrophosphatase